MNDDLKAQWKAWLDGSAPAGPAREALIDALIEQGQVQRVGTPSGKDILLVREKLEDLYIPDPAPVYVDVHHLFTIYEKLAFSSNLLVKGPKGDGKTLSFASFAHMHKLPMVTVECSENTRDTTLTGNFFLRGRDTGFVLGKIPTAIDVANEVGYCILAFEEFNALTPQVQKSTNALLDFRQFVTIPQIGRTYRLKNGAQVWVVATMNPSVYGGTYDLNEDLKSRLEEVEVGYPSPAHEKQLIRAVTNTQVPDEVLDKVITFATETRQPGINYALSPRDTVRLIKTIEKFGGASQNPLERQQALQIALQLVICKFEGDDRNTAKKRAESAFKGVTLQSRWSGA